MAIDPYANVSPSEMTLKGRRQYMERQATLHPEPVMVEKQKAPRVHSKHRRQYIEEHREEITADLFVLGIPGTADKWGLNRTQFYCPKYGCLKRWGINIKDLPKPGWKNRKGGNKPLSEYMKLKAEYAGFRKAVREILGQPVVDQLIAKVQNEIGGGVEDAS